MEFEMCFSNVFSLAPEINDFFRCFVDRTNNTKITNTQRQRENFF